MNIIELQENFEKACYYYACKYSNVESFEGLHEANYVENEDKKPRTPNYYKRITKWNHDSPVPTDEQLMKFSVKEVNEFYDSLIPTFTFIQQRLMNCSDSRLNSLDRSYFKEGDMIFNPEKTGLKIFLNSNFYEIAIGKVAV